MDSLYAQYLRERTEDDIVEEDYGFATYRFIKDQNSVYIIDIYILPEFRKLGYASSLANRIAEIAKERWNVKKMIGSVQPSAKGSDNSLKALLAYGMNIQSSGPDWIIFEKSLD